MLHIPQTAHLVSLLAPAADAGGRSSNFVSLKNAIRAWIVCYLDQGNAATVALTPNQATTVAGAGAKAINSTRIWANQDMAAAVAFTRQTDAAALTTSAAVKVKCVIFQIDTEALDVAGGFDCVRITTGASNAANITSAFLLVEPKNPSDAQLDALAD